MAKTTDQHKLQDILPQLRPGEEDDTVWSSDARAILWTAEHHTEHQRIRNLLALLQGPNLLTHPIEAFGLRRFWPVIDKFLQPVTPAMAEAIAAVSKALSIKGYNHGISHSN